MSENDERTPAPGATCADHEERIAIAVCPHCNRDWCLACWHQPIDTCHQCVMADPGAFGHPIKWEAKKGIASFLFGVTDSFFPNRQSPQFAVGGVSSAFSFFLLSFVPIALLSGIVPFTHTLFFGDVSKAEATERKLNFVAWHIAQVSEPSMEVWLDVLQASGVGLLMSLVLLLAVAAPYVSLCKAYGEGESVVQTAWRAVLYRAWLLPLSDQHGLLRSVFWWAMPGDTQMVELVQLLIVVPVVIYFIHLRAVARYSCGLSSFFSFVPVVIAFIVMGLLDPLILYGLSPWLPTGLALQ